MTVKQLNPYLIFNGTAESAIRLYERVLGAQIEALQRYGEVPGMPGVTEETKSRIIHAHLKIGEGMLMVADAGPGQPVQMGTNAHVVLQFTDPAEMGRTFEALAQGGKVTMPLDDTFWGARFGMLVDHYGAGFMFNCPLDAKK